MAEFDGNDNGTSGDEEFKEYLKKTAEGVGLSEFITSALTDKLEKTTDLVSTLLKAYTKLNDKDPIKKKLRQFIEKLMDESFKSLSVYDFIVMKETENYEKEEEDLNDQQS